MFDCGLPWGEAKKLVGFNRVSSIPILLSHSHRDHCRGALSPGCYNDIYLPGDVLEELPELPKYRCHVVTAGRTFGVGSIRAVAFPVIHDVPCFGYLIQGAGDKAAYITDTAEIPQGLPALSILAVECNYCPERLREAIASGAIDEKLANRTILTHLGLDDVVAYLKTADKTRLTEIHLLHLSDRFGDSEAMRAAVQEVAPSAKVLVADR